MRLMSLLAVAGTLSLTACATAPGSAPATTGGSGSSNAQVASPTQAQQFMTAVEAKRGASLSYAEKIQVQGLAGAARLGLNNAQNSFIDKVGAQVGVNGAVIAAIFPDAAQPVSESEAVKRLEGRLGKKLTAADQSAVKAAAALRNNSVASLKNSLANGIGNRIGMDGATVAALLPLLGF